MQQCHVAMIGICHDGILVIHVICLMASSFMRAVRTITGNTILLFRSTLGRVNTASSLICLHYGYVNLLKEGSSKVVLMQVKMSQ